MAAPTIQELSTQLARLDQVTRTLQAWENDVPPATRVQLEAAGDDLESGIVHVSRAILKEARSRSVHPNRRD